MLAISSTLVFDCFFDSELLVSRSFDEDRHDQGGGDPEPTIAHCPQPSILTDLGIVDSTIRLHSSTEVSPGRSSEPAKLSPRGSRYEFFEEIARGGMGAVVRGIDHDLGRELAVKCILDTHHDRPEIVQRFIDEAQVGGQLQHPGIVPVYDIGMLDDRRPFFAMKLVQGRTLAELLAERAEATDDLPRFLSIFEDICQTMAYAHSKGVIHRDLKPANIMVGEFGEVQVMDWGLAKVKNRAAATASAGASPESEGDVRSASDVETERQGATLEGSVVGTIAYMPPEQANGHVDLVDERADVFALGAILCEILTGNPPYRGAAREAFESARRGDLSAAHRELSCCSAEDELVRITRACLEVDLERRLASAAELTAQVVEYRRSVEERLRAEHMQRVAAETRAVEERKRRKLGLALAASVLALLTVLGAGWRWQERSQLLRAQELAEEKLKAEQEFAIAFQETESLAELARQSAATDVEAWDAALAMADRTHALGENSQLNRSHMLPLKSLATELRKRRQRSRFLQQLDDLRIQQSTVQTDTQYFNRRIGLTLYPTVFRTLDVVAGETEPQLGASRVAAIMAEDTFQAAAALDDWRLLLTTETDGHQETAPVDDPADGDPADGDPANGDGPDGELPADDLVTWMDNVLVLLDQGTVESECRQAMSDQDWDRAQQVLGDASIDELSPIFIVNAATRLLAAGKRAEAKALLVRGSERYPNDLWVMSQLGLHLLLIENDFPPAIRCLSVAVALRESAGTRLNLGLAYEAHGDREAAIAHIKRAVELQPEYALGLFHLGMMLADQGELKEATATLKRSYEISPDLGETRNELALLMIANNEQSSGEALLRESVEAGSLRGAVLLGNHLVEKGELAEGRDLLQQAAAENASDPLAHQGLGDALLAEGNLPAALAEYKEAIALNRNLVESHINAALIYQRMGELERAGTHLEVAMSLRPDDTTLVMNYGGYLVAKGRADEAIERYRAALERDPQLPRIRYNLATLLMERGDSRDAVENLQVVVQLLPDYAEAHCNLGHALNQIGQFREALAAMKRGHELGSQQPDWQYPSADWLKNAEFYAALEPVLEQVLAGEQQPADARQAVSLAGMCLNKGIPHEAVRLYQKAFEISPEFADNGSYRYFAALAAVAAARDARGKGDAETANQQLTVAHQWLRADLAALRSDRYLQQPEQALRLLQRIYNDVGFDSVRSDKNLAKLPPEQGDTWEAFWREVAAAILVLQESAP